MYKRILTKIPIYLLSVIIVLAMFMPDRVVYGAATGYHDVGHSWNHTSHNSTSDCIGCTAVSGKTNCSTCGHSGKVNCTACSTLGRTTQNYNTNGIYNGQSYSYYVLYKGCTNCGGKGETRAFYNSSGVGVGTQELSTYKAGSGKANCSSCGGDGALSSTCSQCNGYGWNYKCTNSNCAQNYDASWDHWTSQSGYKSKCYEAPNTYTVKYNGNGATGGSTSSSSHTYNSSKALTSNGFSRTGYTFQGWATSASGGVSYSNGQSVKNLTSTNGGTVNLYAVWKANTYTVKYNANGGSGSTSSSSHTYNSAKALTANGFSRTGYTFLGWSTSSTATSATYSNKQSVSNLTSSNGGTVNLYAVWKANTYTVKYDGNGSTAGSMSSSTATYDSAFQTRKNGFIKTGYTFNGWNEQADGKHPEQWGLTNSGVYESGKSWKWTYTKSITLYAQWKANTYTVIYNGNGATSGSTSNSSHTYDSAKNLTTNGYKRDGYDFLGWSTTYNATTPEYTDKQSVKNLKSAQGDNLTLFAVWKRTERVVTYNTNGGAFSDGTTSTSKTVYVYDPVDLSLSPIKEGYIFIGWAKHPTNGYPLDELKMPNSNTTLYARYTIPISGLAEKAYFVVWNPSNTKKVVRAKEIPFSKETVNGYEYTLSGFNATTTALGTNVKGAFYIYDNAGNYVAHTFKNTTNTPADTPVKIPDVFTQTTIFKFYDIAAEEYTEIKLEEDIVEGTTYKPLTLPKTINDVEYAMPEGYYSSVTFESTTGQTNASSSYTVTGEETHTYTYQPSMYQITLDANGGKFPGTNNITTKTHNVYYTDYYGSLAVPIREGHTFLGWYTEKSVTSGVTNGKLISPTDIYDIPGNSTLYAAWKVNNYDIIFDYSTNGGKTSDDKLFKTVSVEYGSLVTANLLTEDGVRDGWEFVGWSKDPSATVPDTTFTMPVPENNESMMMYAIYKRNYSYNFIDKTGNQIVTQTLFNKETVGTMTTPSIREFSEWPAIGWTLSTEASEYYDITTNIEFEIYDTSPTEVTYYAVYGKDITVDFIVPSECNPIDTLEKRLYYNASGNETKLTFTVPIPTEKNQYTFVTWECSDGNTFVYKEMPSDGWSVTTSDSLTFTSTWNAYPKLFINHHYYTLEDANAGLITHEDLLTNITATDEEDGDISNISSLYVVGYNASEYIALTGSATFSITYRVIDNFGHIVEKNANVYITDTSTREEPNIYAPRFIEEEYLTATDTSKDNNGDGFVDGKGSGKDFGGLAEKSIWKIDAMHNTALLNALTDRSEKAAINGMNYTFTKSDINAIKEYVKENGYSNFKDVNGRTNFINAFLQKSEEN